MERKLTYSALCNMDGLIVTVKDLEYDSYDQICTVRVKRNITKNSRGKFVCYVSGIELFNDEFVFIYNSAGQCQNGKFEVYSI